MIERYSYIEKIYIADDHLSSKLSLSRNINPAFRIFRILTGTCTIEDSFFGKKYKLTKNYLNFPCTTNTSHRKQVLIDVFPEETEQKDIAEYFDNLINNEEFYKTIEFELLNCIVARQNGRFLESFLFLYRILEGTCYSIPLLYISKSKNFKKSFRALQKSMPTKTNEGELQFFKNFINEHWSSEPFYRLTLDIDISSIEVEEMRSVYFSIYKEKAGKGVEGETEDEELKISFIGFMDFLIELRNRYFHLLQGGWHNNIATSQIIFPDLFFKPIIDLGINWLSIAIFEVIKFDIENHTRK